MTRDPATAAYVWARYRRLMRWLMAVTVALMLVALRLAGQHAQHAAIRRYVLAALGVGVAMLVGATLMGLVFLLRVCSGKPVPSRSPGPTAHLWYAVGGWAWAKGQGAGWHRLWKSALSRFSKQTLKAGGAASENPPPARRQSDAPE